ncbi:methyltransferase [Streptomyces sp. NRRL B-24720]|uniref:methyltransferase n=1 Tax=Streptomyces sp. NRRL B-24720 TaxID=1476876 RepID=UPI003B63515C
MRREGIGPGMDVLDSAQPAAYWPGGRRPAVRPHRPGTPHPRSDRRGPDEPGDLRTAALSAPIDNPAGIGVHANSAQIAAADGAPISNCSKGPGGQPARLGAQVPAVDISRRAMISARLNASLAGLMVSVRRGDLFSAVPERRFDVLVSNPPYVPAPDPNLPRWGARRAWDAGCDGRGLLDRICDSPPGALRSGGLLLLVHSELNGPHRPCADWPGRG